MTDKRFFKAVSMPDADWWQALWPDPVGMLRALDVSQGMAVVDLCCGDGYFTLPLARLVVPAAVYAVELDPEMLAQTQARFGPDDPGNGVWLEIDAMALPDHIPEPVDLVLIANTFHGVHDKTGLCRAAAAVLKPEGRFAVVNWHARPREETPVLGQPRGPATEIRMTPEATAAVAKPAGLTLDHVIDLPPYHYGAVFRKNDA